MSQNAMGGGTVPARNKPQTANDALGQQAVRLPPHFPAGSKLLRRPGVRPSSL